MKMKSAKGLTVSKMFKGPLALGALLSLAVFPEGRASGKVEKSSESTGNQYESAGNEYTSELNSEKVTTEWNDSYLFSSRENASKELESLKKRPQEINETFRPKFEKLSGAVVLDYLETEKAYSKTA